MRKELPFSKLGLSRLIPNLPALVLVAAGALLLAWVGWLTWYDMTVWSKDVGTIFFGARTNEAISLGIGMMVIHYFLIAASLLSVGTIIFIRKRISASEAMAMPKHLRTNGKQSAINGATSKKSSAKDETVTVNEDRFFSGCLHHFGYLSSRPADSPIPQECILCQRLGDCMVATVYVNKINE